jgi:hypothetical protein
MELQRKNMDSVSPGNGISLSRGNLPPEWIVLKKEEVERSAGRLSRRDLQMCSV